MKNRKILMYVGDLDNIINKKLFLYGVLDKVFKEIMAKIGKLSYLLWLLFDHCC